MGKQDTADAKRRVRAKATLASKADVHALYQASVQCAEAEIDFVDDTYLALRKRRARILREDFCGTAAVACEWVRRRSTNRAIGVDLDLDVQAWGRKHNVEPLGRAASKVQLINKNVMTLAPDPVDVVLAMNFSYWTFRDRATLRRYFRRAHLALVADGLMILDAFGGSDAYRELRERSELDGFTYIWDQASFDPINAEIRCHIHFSFPDGSRINRAFSYHWRLWTIPEIRELLLEAGFAKVLVFWQGTDEETNEGNGVFEAVEKGDADPAWIAYLVAEK